jgi:hypothetical protein
LESPDGDAEGFDALAGGLVDGGFFSPAGGCARLRDEAKQNRHKKSRTKSRTLGFIHMKGFPPGAEIRDRTPRGSCETLTIKLSIMLRLVKIAHITANLS